MNFANLKKQSKDFTKLLKKVEEVNKPTYENADNTDNYWKPTPDKAGNALAVIRFLPGAAVDGDDALPWVQYWDHGFQSKTTGKWYIEKSLTTLGQGVKDPVSEYNSMLWNSNSDDNSPERKQAREQKRRLHYVSNIYVVSDPKNPQNEGKVFLFKYGKKIFDKINDLLNPVFEDVKVVNPFDLWEGANFRLRAMQKDGYRTYEKSEFETPSALLDDDDEMEKIWKSQHSLDAVIAPNQFKTYEVLKARLDKVLRINTSNEITSSSSPAEKASPKAKFNREDTTPSWQNDSDDDDSENFFKRIQDDDE
jgi:hypothetical protein